MSQSSSDKYVYFTVGILKESIALEALKQDALKHHMIDQPGQLIALRLTEFYEMMNEGIVQPVVRVPAILSPIEAKEEKQGSTSAPTPSAKSGIAAVPPLPTNHQNQPAYSAQPTLLSQVTGKMRALKREDTFVSASPTADQNADEAADYWSTL
jgi:hypothetical protein